MESNKSPDSISDPAKESVKLPQSKKRGDKPDQKRLVLRAAENSDDEHPEREESAEQMDFNDADFGNAGEWPVDTKQDSAGAPVRRDPEVAKVEKKESKKRPKKIKDQPPKIKDQPEEKKKEKEKMHQSPSSAIKRKASEAVTEKESTTKRNLNMIKTEEDLTADDTEKEEDRKNRRRKEKKIPKMKMKKKKTSAEKIGGEEQKRAGSLKRQKVERGSIHVDKHKDQGRPKVERAPIKPESWHDVEREPLEKIMPHVQYDNLPEDPLMRELKPPPRDPHAYPCTPLPSSGPANSENATDHDKKPVTEPEKKEATSVGEKKDQISAGPEGVDATQCVECSRLSHPHSEPPPAKSFSLKKVMQNPPGYIWIIVVILFVICVGLTAAVFALHKNNGLLAEELRELKEKGGMNTSA